MLFTNRWVYMQSSLRIMTSSNGNIFRVTGPLCGESSATNEFPAQRSVTRSFDVFFDLRLNKWLNKQSRGWWFETLLRPLWRNGHRMPFTSMVYLKYFNRQKIHVCCPIDPVGSLPKVPREFTQCNRAINLGVVGVVYIQSMTFYH